MKIYTSEYPPVPKLFEGSIYEYVFESEYSEVTPSKVAYINTATDQKVTYSELKEQSLRFADGLINIAGVRRGETILIFSPNSTIYPVLVLACSAAGIICTTANATYTGSEVAHQLSLSRAGLILVASENVAVAKEAADIVGVPHNKIYVLPGPEDHLDTAGLKSYEELRGRPDFKFAKVDCHAPALLPFSSGTTSKPKGVALSSQNVTSLSQIVDNVPGLFYEKNEVILGALPLNHMYGLFLMLVHTLHCGATLCLMPRFDLELYCKNVQKYNATLGFVVPPICVLLAKHPIVDKYDVSTLRMLFSGAAPLSYSLLKALEKRLNVRVSQGYGMTETTCIATLPDVDDENTASAGKLIPNMQARVVDENGNDVPEGTAGELWVRGPNIMKEYLHNTEATADAFSKEGNWFKTGDVCVMTQSPDRPNSYWSTIVDRWKELIKYKGFQVTPSELEAVLLGCDLVDDAGVIGVWSEEEQTELPRAYVVVNSKYLNDPDVGKKIGEFVASKVANYKRLRGGIFKIEAVPKNISGKILRKELRALAAKVDTVTAKL